MREIVNGIFYVLRAGCPLAADPVGPAALVDAVALGAGRDDGLFERISHRLVVADRERRGREACPSAAVVDSQSVKTTENGGPRGFDAAKKVLGRKRHVMVDTDGRPLGLLIHPADVQDRDGAVPLLRTRARATRSLPRPSPTAPTTSNASPAPPAPPASTCRSSAGSPTRPASSSIRAAGSSSVPSRGSTETAASRRISRRRSPRQHATVDAIGLPIRIHPTPGQYGDSPQAVALLSGLAGVGHVIADAAYDADPLRAFIAGELGATAQIKANPGRTGKPPIDWRLYKERHQVECFFNKLKRCRRIALRREKTIAAFMGFVHLACAMIWIR